MIQRVRMLHCLGLLGLSVAIGCGKSDDPAPIVKPIAAANGQPKNEPAKAADAKDDSKSVALPPGGAFIFPQDEGGKILQRTLPPQSTAPLQTLPAKTANERVLPGYLATPNAAAVPSSVAPARYPQPSRVAPRPVPLPDRVPLSLAQRDLEWPESIVLPVGALTRIDALDVREPTALPILARPGSDRASLEDPTTEFTSRSIINPNLPLRVTFAIFVKVNLPDPFEHAAAAKVKQTLPDDPNTALGSPPIPKP